MKIIYHGSKDIIVKPTYGKGKLHNDYGLGFYCTKSEQLACEWAVGYKKDGYANKYEIDDSNLKILDLNDSKYNILNWLAILLKNRYFEISHQIVKDAKQYLLENFLIDYSKYDVIVGYRADDSYFAFANDFLSGIISYTQLSRAMHLCNLGTQYVLKSKKAFNKIKYVGSIPSLYKDWYPKKEKRDHDARDSYFNTQQNRIPHDLYISQIVDDRMKQDDPRLQ